MKFKIIILIIIVVFGLLLNYEKEKGYFLEIFPLVEKPSLAQIPLYKNPEGNFLSKKNIWGWPFGYWREGEFNFKSLLFNLIFYLAIWLIILFFIWFISRIKKLEERRVKPPKFEF